MIKVYKCQRCGNVVVKVINHGCESLTCCGEPMVEMKANTTDGAREKHVPVVEVAGGLVKVRVGSVEHPMLPEHHIGLIILETSAGVQYRTLQAGQAPEAVFALAEGETPVAAYEYCNLHGFWKAEI